MSEPITYKNVIKFKNSQRLFKGSDGKFYLADESAELEGVGGHVGRPNETEDGPVYICQDKPIECRWDKDMGIAFNVACFSTVRVKWCTVGVSGDAALYLAAHLGMTLKSTTGEYRINNLPATSEDRGVLSV